MSEDNKQIDIINEIQIRYATFSKGQKKIADFVLSDYEKVAFMTAKKLGVESGTSESTAVRFAFELGFESYTTFQKSLASLIQKKLSSVSSIALDCDTASNKGIFRTVLKNDSDNVAGTLDIIDYVSFDNAIESISNAKHVYVIGLGTSKALADILCQNLNIIRPDVIEIATTSTSEIFEQLIHLSKEDCVIGIGFPDYSVRTVKALEFANEMNARIVAITDNRYSPMVLYSSCNLYAPCEMYEDIISLTAPMSVVNALVVGLRIRCKKDYEDNIAKLNDVWENYSL